VFVNIKFVGENAVVNFICSYGNPNPTLFGFGTIFSVTSSLVPEPNCICKDDNDKNLVANLLATFFNLNKYGISLSIEKLGSLVFVFFIVSYIVS
jgi:hypothetical protein